MFYTLLIVFITSAGMMASDDVAKRILADGVVPDVLDVAPSSKVNVIYPDHKEVDFGAELTPTEVKEQPRVTWEYKPDQYYTLSMVDPDVPTRENPTGRSINHWLVVNIKENDISTGQTLTSYHGSRPRKNHGFHRYVFFVFQQQGKLTVEEEAKFETARRNFSVKDFAKKYSLGNPIAGNYFNAQWDSSIPEKLL